MDISNITAFAGYNVQIKAGDCKIRKEDWNRNDFPFWKYFEEATNAECLNNWKAKGPDISEWSDYAQKGAKSIADSQITIIMPDSLKQKMEADSDFASEIMKKVSDWKKTMILRIWQLVCLMERVIRKLKWICRREVI